MTLNLSSFEKAQNRFYDLERVASDLGTAFITDEEGERLFSTASLAAAVLHRLGRKRLIELEKMNIVHGSTITGGSLSSAMISIEQYFLYEKRMFDRDEYEQLGRTCQSAKKIYEASIQIPFSP